MVYLTGFIRIIVLSGEYLHGMPDITEGDQAGVDKEKESPAQEQYKQGGAPEQVTEINDLLSEIFQWIRLGGLKIIIIRCCLNFNFLLSLAILN